MPCTTILVGKNASYDGSTMVARNEDSPSGQYAAKKMIVVHPEDQPKVYRSVISHVEIPLPEATMKYTLTPDALGKDGIWGACGINEANVAMSATETITSNERVLSGDPLVEYQAAKGKEGDADYQPEVPGGIGEEDMVSLVLPYIKSAREGVERLGEILKEYGTYEMNGIAFQDVDEIWWLETIGGHHWMAKRVPDDAYVMMPNQLGIDDFDFDDAFGAQENHMCSEDLREFVRDNFLDLSMEDDFNPRHAFGSNSDADHIYNTPRAWIMGRYFNPMTFVWDGEDADYTPFSDDLPWCLVPERKITVADIKYILSNHFQGTPYDPYGKEGDPHLHGIFRSIGVNRTNFMGLTQIRPYLPESLRAVQWMAFGSNVYNAIVPLYTQVDEIPAYFSQVGKQVTTDNVYWSNRIIAALADPHHFACDAIIERYQDKVIRNTMKVMKDTEKVVGEGADAGAVKVACQMANAKIADILKEETYDVLDKVLYQASNVMKNGFSRSDN